MLLYQLITGGSLWHIGIGVSIALAFIVTVLSFSEIEESLPIDSTLQEKPALTPAIEEQSILQISDEKHQVALNHLHEELAQLQYSNASKIASYEKALSEREALHIKQLAILEANRDELQKMLIQKERNLTVSLQEQEVKIHTLENALSEREALLKDRLKIIEAVRHDSELRANQRSQEIAILQDQLLATQSELKTLLVSTKASDVITQTDYAQRLVKQREDEIADLRHCMRVAIDNAAQEKQESDHIIAGLRQHLQKANEDSAHSLAIRQNEISDLSQRLQNTIQDANQAQKQRELVLIDLHQRLHNASEEIKQAQQERDNHQTALSIERELNESNRVYAEQAQREHLRHQTIAQELNEHIETITREKTLLESTVSRLQIGLETLSQEKQAFIDAVKAEKEGLTQELQLITHERNQAVTNLTDIERAWRCSEGRYQQLKEQFNKKSITLDETRRQLFHAQENLLKLERTQTELLCERSIEDRALEQHIIRLDQAYATLQENYYCEVDALQELIASLNNKRNST